MAGTNVVNALGEVASAVRETDAGGTAAKEVGTMGIKGVIWNNVAQLTATTILSGAFLYLGREYIVQSREKDVMFRDEMKSLRVSHDDAIRTLITAQEKRSEKTEVVHSKAMEKMGATVERSVDAMETTVEAMKEAVRELKATNAKIQPQAIRPAVPPPD